MDINSVLKDVEGKEIIHLEDFDYPYWLEVIQMGLVLRADDGDYLFGKQIIGLDVFIESEYFKESVLHSIKIIRSFCEPWYVKLFRRIKVVK